jgi:ABC-type sugar transport system ATPase subunit
LSQRPALYGHLDVERNLMIGWEMGGGRQAEARLRANEAAEWLGIRDLLRRRPGELSGGEEQRVALGRAMVRQARLWLLDEPFAHLDPARSRQLRQDLPLLASRSGATIVSVTHDPVEAALADRLAVLDHGRLVQCDFPGAVWNDPSRLTVATWLARLPLNRLDGSVERRPLENAPGEWQFRDPSGFLAKSWPASPERIWRDGQAVTALVRPEDLVLSPASEPPLVTVIRVEPQWPAWLVVVAAGDWHGVSWWTSDPPPQPGTTWSVQFRRVLWFDEHGQRLTTASA